MRNPKRIPEMMSMIKAIWSANSSLRLGQLIQNALMDCPDFYYLEDDELHDKLYEFYYERG